MSSGRGKGCGRRRPSQFSLNLSKVGKGKIVSDPAGINCGATARETFDEGSEVTLTAKARTGWEFKRWRYRCKGQGKVCTIDVTSNFRAVAVFTAAPIACGARKDEPGPNCP